MAVAEKKLGQIAAHLPAKIERQFRRIAEMEGRPSASDLARELLIAHVLEYEKKFEAMKTIFDEDWN